MNAEKQIEQINASLETVSDQLKSMAEKAEKDIKARGAIDAELRASIDQTLTQQGEMQARLATAEQLLAQVQNGGSGHTGARSIGSMVTDSDDFRAYAANPRGDFRMSVQAALTTDGDSAGGAGDLVVPQRVAGVVAPGLRRLTVRDLISWGRTTSNSIEYARETMFDNQADLVAEGDMKPESDIAFEAVSAPVVTIAHWVPASKQIIADVPMLQSYVDGRLRYGLKLKEEAQLLKGSGVGLNIDGIHTQAESYSNPGVNVDAETRIDRLRLALLQVELAEYWADGIVISPIDWAAIELTKTDDNAYLFANPRTVNAPGLWGRNVVPTQAMDPGEFLVGAFGGAVAVEGWDREDVTVAISEHDRDNFIRNMLTIRCEERIALTVYRPESFVKGDFSGIDAS